MDGRRGSRRDDRRARRPVPRCVVGVMLFGSVAAGCSLTDVRSEVVAQRSDPISSTSTDDDPPTTVTSTVPTDVATDGSDGVAENRDRDPSASESDPAEAGAVDDETAEILDELVANGFCEPTDFDDDGVVTAIHFVVDGSLQTPCFVAPAEDGVDDVVVDDDPRLIDAWNELLAVTPLSLVDDISLIAGFEGCPVCDTLAYVTTLDVASEFFVIAVDVEAGVADPDELRLTMLHELSHVFTQRPGEQLVVQDEAAPCDTFFNGNGCFTDDSYMWAWIEEFWPAEVLGTLPSDGGVGSDDDAFERCDLDAGFVGSYAASHPEEDFAETFSAYVFDVEVDPAVADRYSFFDRYPEFVEVRENARAAGLAGATDDNFEGCGR